MKEFWNKARKNHAFIISACMAAVLVLIVVFADFFLVHDPYLEDFGSMLLPPGEGHICGTDPIGRCLACRILSGAKYSLLASFLMAFLTAFIGTILGMMAGYLRGATDAVIMRLCDALLSLPTTICAIAVIAVLGSGLDHLVLTLSLLWWTKYARLTRNLVLRIRSLEYITEAQLGGENTFRIITRYIMPNILPEVVVMCALDMGKMLLTIAGMSYLGLSAQPPTPEWGYMLSEGRRYIQTAPWMIIFPGLAILLSVLCFNTLGDSIRDIMDPRYVPGRRRIGFRAAKAHDRR